VFFRKAPQPCRCFVCLGVAIEHPEALFLDLRDPSWLGFGSISLDAGSRRHELQFCFACGGKLGAYRPEAAEAYRRFVEARARYAALRDLREADAIGAECARLGAHEVSAHASGHAHQFLDATNHIAIDATYDPDHERFHVAFAFAPGEELTRSPFREPPAAPSRSPFGGR
jgi:hypothetical protein